MTEPTRIVICEACAAKRCEECSAVVWFEGPIICECDHRNLPDMTQAVP